MCFHTWLGKAPVISIVCVIKMREEAIAQKARHETEGLSPHIWVPKPAGGRAGWERVPDIVGRSLTVGFGCCHGIEGLYYKGVSYPCLAQLFQGERQEPACLSCFFAVLAQSESLETTSCSQLLLVEMSIIF